MRANSFGFAVSTRAALSASAAICLAAFAAPALAQEAKPAADAPAAA
ncbi:MAG: hypothetical protein RLY97_724, partial [Pseudomonadota bacterium]